MIRKLLVSVSLLASAWSGIASAAWQEASSAHFIVYSDDKPERVRAFTERLERFDKALRVSRNFPDEQTTDAERVRVYMFGGVSDVQKLAGKTMKNVAGFYQSRVGGPVAFVPRDAPKDSPYDLDAQSILFHEYTHHWMFLNFSSSVFPAWFVEGFAEFNATATVERDGKIRFGGFPAYRVWSVTDSTLLPAARLLQLDPGKLREDQRDALYSRGWLLMHFLTYEPTRKGQLSQYLQALNKGNTADNAAKVFGDLKKLDRDMTAYIMTGKIWTSTLAAEKLPIGKITLRPLGMGEAAVMPALLQTTRGVDAVTAKSVVLLARRLAAPFPNDAGAQNELAEAEYDAGNWIECETAVDRALTADPKSMHALIYKGMVKMAMLIKADDTNQTNWRTARSWFIKANAIDSDNPRPLMLFYQSFLVGHMKPTTNAEDGLITAYKLAPFAYDLRMNAAAILLRRGDKDGARTALLPVAYSPHREGYSSLALNVLTALDNGDVGMAKRLLDKGGREAEQVAGKPAEPTEPGKEGKTAP